MSKGGQPTKYTDERAKAICDAVSNGASLLAAAKVVKIDAMTAYRWMDTHPEFCGDYARARVTRGEHYGALVSSIAEECHRGDIDPNAARVAMDGYKWTAARMAPKNWGDKREVDLKVEGFIQHTHITDEGLIQGIQAIRERRVLAAQNGSARRLESAQNGSEN